MMSGRSLTSTGPARAVQHSGNPESVFDPSAVFEHEIGQFQLLAKILNGCLKEPFSKISFDDRHKIRGDIHPDLAALLKAELPSVGSILETRGQLIENCGRRPVAKHIARMLVACDQCRSSTNRSGDLKGREWQISNVAEENGWSHAACMAGIFYANRGSDFPPQIAIIIKEIEKWHRRLDVANWVLERAIVVAETLWSMENPISPSDDEIPF